ncbi:MAG: hypothetical protein BGO01_07345 [Armatimonadetes bacterium 55-13]|nr:MAG: hypothetical protein BGO01_07345 [Armatimonadetes bacterium 55-13]
MSGTICYLSVGTLMNLKWSDWKLGSTPFVRAVSSSGSRALYPHPCSVVLPKLHGSDIPHIDFDGYEGGGEDHWAIRTHFKDGGGLLLKAPGSRPFFSEVNPEVHEKGVTHVSGTNGHLSVGTLTYLEPELAY